MACLRLDDGEYGHVLLSIMPGVIIGSVGSDEQLRYEHDISSSSNHAHWLPDWWWNWSPLILFAALWAISIFMGRMHLWNTSLLSGEIPGCSIWATLSIRVHNILPKKKISWMRLSGTSWLLMDCSQKDHNAPHSGKSPFSLLHIHFHQCLWLWCFFWWSSSIISIFSTNSSPWRHPNSLALGPLFLTCSNSIQSLFTTGVPAISLGSLLWP